MDSIHACAHGNASPIYLPNSDGPFLPPFCPALPPSVHVNELPHERGYKTRAQGPFSSQPHTQEPVENVESVTGCGELYTETGDSVSRFRWR
jgi:hypothetical protein